ncbi:unnamed protein product, partial [marine sediment metagenome]
SAKISTTITVAAGFNGSAIFYMSAVPQADGAILGKGKSVSTISGRQDTVEHINAGPDSGNDIGWCADAHQMAR